MTLVLDGPVTPVALTTFMREVPVQSDLTMLNAFPTRNLDKNTVDFAEITRTNRTARYRSFDGRIHVSERDGGTEKRVRLLPLSSSLNTGELERLQLEFARTGGTNEQALANAIYNDAEQLTREILARLEQAWGDVLTDGVLTINENDFQGEADFGVPANQKGVAPAGAVWSDVAASTPLTDILAWQDIAVANGWKPEALRTSQANIRLLQRNKEIIDAVYGATAGRTRVTLTELNDLLSSEGLPILAPAYDTQVDVDGATARTIPADRVLLTPANLGDLGYTAWGVSATALTLVGSSAVEFAFESAPGIVGVIEKVGPPYREYVFADAVAMPILADARKLFIADVR